MTEIPEYDVICCNNCNSLMWVNNSTGKCGICGKLIKQILKEKYDKPRKNNRRNRKCSKSNNK